jgi:glucose-6-phosphate isomerase
VVTEPRDNPLRRLAASRGIETLDHDPGLGGRYSVLSLVGLLPAMMAGLDPFAVRQGAAEVLDAALAAEQPAESPPAVGAALGHGLARERGQTQAVLMPYADALAPFGSWFRQLWAESLGKGGLGTTPITALGAVDQHSQLQLYLDGPPDKFYTVILLDRDGTGERVDPRTAGDRELGYLAGRTMGDLIAAEQEATVETLARHARPVRVLRLTRLDERAMGALFMHFMLETIIAAELARVDPFDQPAVEEGKRLARDRLAGMAPKS